MMKSEEILTILTNLECPIRERVSEKDIIEYLTKPSDKRTDFLFWLLDTSQLYCPIDQKMLATEKKQLFSQRHTKAKNAFPEDEQDSNPLSKDLVNILFCYGCCSSETESMDVLSGKCSAELQLASFLHLLRFLNCCKYQVDNDLSTSEHHPPVDQMKRDCLLLEKIGQRSRSQNNPLISLQSISFLPPDIKRELAEDLAKYKKENNFSLFIETVKSSRTDQLSRIKGELREINEEISGFNDGLQLDQSHLQRLKVTINELSQLFDSFIFACNHDFDPLLSRTSDTVSESHPVIHLSSLGPSAKRLEAQVDNIQSYFSLLKSIEDRVTNIRKVCDSLPTDNYSLINESVVALCNDINDLMQ